MAQAYNPGTGEGSASTISTTVTAVGSETLRWLHGSLASQGGEGSGELLAKVSREQLSSLVVLQLL